MMLKEETLKSLLRDVPDFPKPGILFKDITPLLAEPAARRQVVNEIANYFRDKQIDAVAAVEARGFIFGMLIAEALNVAFVPVRKAGKLPYHKLREEYDLEYGRAAIEMHVDALKPGSRVLIHDDLLATGGTAGAAGNLIQKLGGVVAGYSFIINLSFLPGEKILSDKFGVRPHYLVKY
ncbi:MAG TPA: adenine phosphoribosyltransferase [Cyclobacteriaceae bacterium]|nr:adenine phosphoribosyltransferase [Cyclobacteriaceae bacterium]HNU41649.1 adenine phosphoribosyltransferase [Cyclobacteriaceae bacterium]